MDLEGTGMGGVLEDKIPIVNFFMIVAHAIVVHSIFIVSAFAGFVLFEIGLRLESKLRVVILTGWTLS